MTVEELLTQLTRLFFLLLNIITFAYYVRHRTTIDRTIFLMFLSLTLGIWIQLFRSVLNFDLPWLSKVSQLAIVAQPFLMLHLVQYFQQVNPTLYRGSIVGMIVSWIGILLSAATLSVTATILIIIYFVIVDGYASIALIHGAFSTIGVVRQRLRFAALGSAILALILALAGVNAVAPSAREVTFPIIQFMSICCASAYYLGFAPPRWLREAWQHTELRNYLQQLHSVSDRTTLEIFHQLYTAVNRVMGTNIVSIKAALWDKESQQLALHYPPSSGEPSTDLQLDETFHNVWREQKAQAFYHSDDLDTDIDNLLKKSKAEMILVVPLATYENPLGLLIVLLQQGSLFVEDELRLLSIFAQQTAILLQNYAMLEDSKNYAEDLEEKVRQRTVELERLNEELRLLAYVASHDLQEPLRTISSYLQLVELRYSDGLSEDARELFAFVLNAVAHMKELIQDILTYSRMETQLANFSLFNCQAVLDEVCTVLDVAIKESDTIITHDELPQIRADKRLIIQLFQNLLSNAVKYRGDRKPQIHIGVTRIGQEWQFSVRDNGIGIEPQYLEKIFIIFQRLHLREDYQGTGIGLAVCKKAIDLHNGRIWAESEFGSGTTFYFTLPAI